jgi:hypothetical protein
MFQDMLDAREAGRAPVETFYDGYVVNAVIDSCYKSMKSGRWEPVEIQGWRGNAVPPMKGPGKASGRLQEAKSGANKGQGTGGAKNRGLAVIKTERLPDGRTKRILKDKATGRIVERIE